MKSQSYFTKVLRALGSLICLILIACWMFFTGPEKRVKQDAPVEHKIQLIAAYNTLPTYSKGKVDDLSNYRQSCASGRQINDKASI